MGGPGLVSGDVGRGGKGPALIGLTGNIATGKSMVAQMLAELGACVIDADKVAHEVMAPGGPAYGAVVHAFGREVLALDGTVDRRKLGEVVFRDPDALRRLEMAVHPATITEVTRRIVEATEAVVVVEAIKLIEAGMHRGYAALWVVTAPRELQIERLMSKRGLTEEAAILRVDSQPPQEEKVAVADVVITNDGDLDALREKVQAAWSEIRAGWDREPGAAGNPGLKPGNAEVIVRRVRRDDIQDAAGVAEVLNGVITEGGHTALTGHWTPEAERVFLQSLRPRSEVFVAEMAGRIVGFQVIEPFVSYTSSMNHVAHMGTYVRTEHRGRGIGQKLAEATLAFAQEQEYEKVVIYVMAGNELGLAYYRKLGFEEKGVLRRQTKIQGVYHDEVFMELHFEEQGRE